MSRLIDADKLLDEWVKRGFKETPEEMVRIFYAVMDDRSDI